MILSYSLRLLCLLTLVVGLVQAALQLVLSFNARFVLRRIEGVSSRRRERILYLLQIGPSLLAVLVAGGLCLPEYLRYEPTREPEPVGWITVLLAAAVSIWFGFALLRGLRIALRTLRFTRICRHSGRLVRHSGGAPILALAEPIVPLGLVGLFRPFILISVDMLEAGGLNAGALQVALDHERSHALHLDNWKLFSLSFVPRLPADRWQRHWQIATDWAADDDAACGDPGRSLLLAEALVRAARSVKPSHSPLICTALTSAEAGLALRIDRLLRPRRPSRSAGTSLVLGLAGLVFVAIGAAAIASPSIYSVSEHILHLGGF